jgi:hypothetical protein
MTILSSEAIQQAQPALTREQIDAAIRSLQPVERVMIKLLLLQFLDPTLDDVHLMAQERSEPQMKAGSKLGGLPLAPGRAIVLPKAWITAIQDSVQQYATQLREHRERLDLQLAFLKDYLAGLQLELHAIEALLKAEHNFSAENFDELRQQARQAPAFYPLKKLMDRAEKQEIEEADYVRERLGLEYQAHSRRRDRFKKRLEQTLQERQALLMSSLSDEHLATIWGIAKGPILNRRVKAMQKYVSALAGVLQAPLADMEYAAAVTAGMGSRMPGGSKNEGIGSITVESKGDLWSKTIQSLAPAPAPTEVKPCEHDGGGKALLGKLRQLAVYLMPEEEERKLWTRTVQCASCVSRIRTLQVDSHIAAESSEMVVERLKARTAMPRKEEPKPAQPESPEVTAEKLAELEERLRPFIGTDILPEGSTRW